MVLDLLTYPDERIRLISGNIRFFDDSLNNIITDLIDTMKANDLEALSAIQIGIQYAVIVLKEDGTYNPYINLRIIGHEGTKTETERTPYYEGISVDVPRHEKIKIFYEDENGAPHYDDVEGDKARILQHHIDYNYGSTFVDRVDKETKQRIGEHLSEGLVESSNSSCPTVFVRDYIKQAYKYVMLLVWISFLVPLFTEDSSILNGLFLFDKIALTLVVPIVILYAIYAYYESVKFKQCTSCQFGNVMGTIAFAGVQWVILNIITYFWIAT